MCLYVCYHTCAQGCVFWFIDYCFVCVCVVVGIVKIRSIGKTSNQAPSSEPVSNLTQRSIANGEWWKTLHTLFHCVNLRARLCSRVLDSSPLSYCVNIFELHNYRVPSMSLSVGNISSYRLLVGLWVFRITFFSTCDRYRCKMCALPTADAYLTHTRSRVLSSVSFTPIVWWSSDLTVTDSSLIDLPVITLTSYTFTPLSVCLIISCISRQASESWITGEYSECILYSAWVRTVSCTHRYFCVWCVILVRNIFLSYFLSFSERPVCFILSSTLKIKYLKHHFLPNIRTTSLHCAFWQVFLFLFTVVEDSVGLSSCHYCSCFRYIIVTRVSVSTVNF